MGWWPDAVASGGGFLVGYALGVWRRRWRRITIVVEADTPLSPDPHR